MPYKFSRAHIEENSISTSGKSRNKRRNLTNLKIMLLLTITDVYLYMQKDM